MASSRPSGSGEAAQVTLPLCLSTVTGKVLRLWVAPIMDEGNKHLAGVWSVFNEQSLTFPEACLVTLPRVAFIATLN